MIDKLEIETDPQSIYSHSEPTIALLLWGDAFDDFLDSIGVSLEKFCNEGPGGWVRGYIDALRLVGIRTTLIFIASTTDSPLRFKDPSTGTTISVLPASKWYRFIRHHMVHPYPSLCTNFSDLFGDVKGIRRLFLKILYPAISYLATPVGCLIDELKREKCNVILCQEYEYARFDICVLLGKLLQIPVFATFQGGNSDWNLIGRFLRPFTIKNCAGLVIAAKTEIQRVHDSYPILPEKIAKVYNPIDLRKWRATNCGEARAIFNIPPDAEVIVWHGRIDIYTKGLDLLLEAWSRVCSERTERKLYLHLLGTGTDEEKFRKLINALPVQNVRWINQYITDHNMLQYFLSTGDIYAFPSRHEGFAVAPIEAMACGLPIVATEAPGVPDLLMGGETSGGVLVPNNDVEAFTGALGTILDDRVLRLKLGQNARRRVEEDFSLEVIGKQLRDFLFQS